jgi:hypothetical protein
MYDFILYVTSLYEFLVSRPILMPLVATTLLYISSFKVITPTREAMEFIKYERHFFIL